MIKIFTINETPFHDAGTFQFEEGMIWTEWLASSYNTENWFALSDGRISRQSTSGWLCAGFSVKVTDTIESTNVYSFDLIIE